VLNVLAKNQARKTKIIDAITRTKKIAYSKNMNKIYSDVRSIWKYQFIFIFWFYIFAYRYL